MSSEKAQPMMPNDAQNPANNPAICSREAPGTMLDTEETEARIELENVLQKFQGDIEKLFLNKQKSMRKNVNASLTAIQKKLELVLKMQQKRRKRLYQESYRGLVSMCLSSKKDMKNFKKEEERMTVRFQKQEESFSACLSVQKCRLEGFEMLCEQYFKKLRQVSIVHADEILCEKHFFKERMSSLKGLILNSNVCSSQSSPQHAINERVRTPGTAGSTTLEAGASTSNNEQAGNLHLNKSSASPCIPENPFAWATF